MTDSANEHLCIFCKLRPMLPGRAACADCYIERTDKIEAELQAMKNTPTNQHREQAREIARCTFHGDPLPTINGLMIASASSSPEIALADYIEAALASRDAEIKEVLESFDWRKDQNGMCWCEGKPHAFYCVAARTLYDKVTNAAPTSGPISKPPRRRSKKEQLAEELRQSDLVGQLTDRQDIEYGPHDSLPRGEHIANLRKSVKE